MEEDVKESNELKVNWSSIVNFPIFGYCNSSKNLMLALHQNNVHVSYRYVYGPGTILQLAEKPTSDFSIKKFQDEPYYDNFPEIVYGQGDVFFKNRGSYKIGFTMLEVDGIPTEWVRQCNLMNEVWVPSTFNKETFRESGVKVPIYVIPLGVNPEIFNPRLNQFRYSSKFTFLTVFQWQERKNPFLLLDSFLKGFSHSNDVVLVLKTTKDVRPELVRRGYGEYLNSKIIVDSRILPEEALGALYRGADCFVFPTSGEGWGMPILEAMACGIPVVSTAWGGQKDFFNQETGFPININRLVPASNNIYYRDFQWCEPNKDHLIELMIYIHQNRDTVRKKCLKTAETVASKYTWNHSAEKIRYRLLSI